MLIVVRGPTFFSENDEAAMFEWLEKIGATVQGSGRDLHITLNLPLERKTIKELTVLFSRYKLDMQALATLKSPYSIHNDSQG